ncbi:hypothetical protein SteCoe_4042 [Stentor coeruleus]|uniref:Prefoldin subunit 2 n=1 Tax=Stentor coeruleus TaxID=5963 RepID=A0A1R2CVR2_9CILI|nr:hypothetical protein SteCoe_4042 [Stentor coeruleus]
MSEQPVQRYQLLRQDYGQLVGKITEIESEKREHLIVLETLKKVEPVRRCWRLVGGVLVQKTVSDVIPELEQQSSKMDQILHVLFARLKEIEGELRELEQILGVKTDIKPNLPQEKSGGVLVIKIEIRYNLFVNFLDNVIWIYLLFNTEKRGFVIYFIMLYENNSLFFVLNLIKPNAK